MDVRIAGAFTDTRARDHLLVNSVEPSPEFLQDIAAHNLRKRE